jgi:D-sedoheptulose 7-phosphate isomerase
LSPTLLLNKKRILEYDSFKENIQTSINDHQSVVRKLPELDDELSAIAERMISCLENGGKILLFGNGGSAADCQHLAAELVGRFQRERQGLAAIALTTDSSVLTSIANDYGFESVFERQIEALCSEGDVVIGISTSGNSTNVIKGLKKADELGAVAIGFTGSGESSIDQVTQYCLKIPSSNTARIQEMHILCGHILCEIIENSIVQKYQ